MSYRSVPTRWLASLILLLISSVGPCASGNAGAQPVTTVLSQAPITIEEAKSRIQALEANTALNELDRARAIEIYRQMAADLEAASVWDTKQAQYRDLTQTIADELERAEQALAVAPPTPAVEVAGLDQKQLDDRVQLLKVQQDEAQKKLESLQQEVERRTARRAEIEKSISAADETRLKLENQPATPDTANAPADLRDALALQRNVMLYNRQLELQALRSEQSYYAAAAPLLPKQLESAQRTLQQATEATRQWVARADEKRQVGAQLDKAEKETKARAVPDELKPLADHNLELSKRREKLVDLIARTSSDTQTAEDQYHRWSDQFNRVKQLIVTQTRVTESIGGLLREQRNQLPNVAQLRRANDERRMQSYEVRSDRFTNAEELLRMEPLERRVDVELSALPSSVPPARRAELRPEIQALLETRRQALSDLETSYDTLLVNASNLNVKEEDLIDLVTRYTTFIDQHVLWIRSTPSLSWHDLQVLPSVLRSLLARIDGTRLFRAVLAAFERSILLHFAICLALVLALVYRQSIIQRIEELGEYATSRTCRSINPTIKVLLWTIALSLPGPVAVAWIGAILGTVPNQWDAETEVASALALATQQSAIVYWPIAFWLNVVRRRGLAEMHFSWHEPLLKLTRRQFTSCIPTLVPAAACFYFFASTNNPRWQQSVARLALIFASLVLTWVVQRLLAPHAGIPYGYLAEHRDGWLYRLRFVWYGMLVAIPICIALLGIAGYLYTAQRLSECLYRSAVFASGMYLIWSTTSRWILLNRRAIAIAQARERMAVATQSAEKTRSEGAVTAAIAEQVDLVQVNAQTNRLLTSFAFTAAMLGMYLIWIDVLPALSRLNDIHLWRESETIVSTHALASPTVGQFEPTGSDTRPALPTFGTTERWITLGNLIGALLILVLAWIAVRNIPGLLEIAVLQHLPLDASTRYLVTTITRYVLILAGSASALNSVGFGWSKIQWLAAGVSVGLGFGLQEIFANFIAGLMLLFERPLRAGDVITVGDVTGTVVNIKTRATTILDWDHKELIVPNKELITGKLLNWTLSNTINRVVINVGIAYGTNVDQARALLLACAEAHPSVLNDPPPTVTFDRFGDSSLSFTLRCYLGDLQDRLETVHQLHAQINASLAAARINIPYPQRDVHLIRGDES